jgi:hypothetical protein
MATPPMATLPVVEPSALKLVELLKLVISRSEERERNIRSGAKSGCFEYDQSDGEIEEELTRFIQREQRRRERANDIINLIEAGYFPSSNENNKHWISVLAESTYLDKEGTVRKWVASLGWDLPLLSV